MDERNPAGARPAGLGPAEPTRLAEPARPMMPMGPAELLAPVGDGAALRAALATGADAVYLGLDRWSARAFAGNFTGHELVAAIERAHLYGARAHLALNTLLKEDELRPALAALQGPYEAGLDALIVADLGFAALVRETYPDLDLHASTQLNTHSSEQLAALAGQGFRRAILARELSLAEIERLDAHGLELEVFVHGALCYGYSGLCLFSSMIGGRSGNRGRCSQACRMRYRLLVGETGTELSRLLSTSDLAAIAVLPQLLRAGVASFKIEGRMKDAAYVATATAVYRQALDAALADPEHYEVRDEWLRRLEQSFSRGFTNAHLEGDHAHVRSRGRSGHRGVAVGRVESMDEERGLVTIHLTAPLHDNDVVSIYTPVGQTEPVRVGAVRVAAPGHHRRSGASGAEGKAMASGSPLVGADADELGDHVILQLTERVAVKDRLFRLSSGEIDAFAQAAVAGRLRLRPLRLRARLEGAVGEPARLTVAPTSAPTVASTASPTASLAVDRWWGDSAVYLTVSVDGAEPLRSARTAPLNAEKAGAALGALGGTPYELAELDFAVAGSAFMAVGALRDLRRRALAELDQRRLAARRRPALQPTPASQPAAVVVAVADEQRPAPTAVSSAASVNRPAAACSIKTRETVSPFARSVAGGFQAIVRLVADEPAPAAPGVIGWCLELAGDESAAILERTITRLHATGGEVRCRPPVILFDSDEVWWQATAQLPWDAVYARHLSHLRAPAPIILEYPLQGLNAEVARRLRPRAVVASPEASLEELTQLTMVLADLNQPMAVEVVAFARQELLVTRDRLGVAEGLVSDRPPGDAEESQSLSLVDSKGFVFRAVVSARGSSIANARVTNLAPHLGDLAGAGVAVAIVDFGDMNAAERDAFAAHGVAGLAAFADRERSTSGHLFRGVA
ncbi:MAG: peptidase U32 family protein [Thermoleophilia bacterium]